MFDPCCCPVCSQKSQYRSTDFYGANLGLMRFDAYFLSAFSIVMVGSLALKTIRVG